MSEMWHGHKRKTTDFLTRLTRDFDNYDDQAEH